MAYLVLADALTRAKERSGATSADDLFLTELLTLSAGVDADGITHYRPFYVAANWLSQNLSGQALKSADGVVFSGQATPIASLLALQSGYDSAQGLTVPAGFEAIPPAKTRSTRSSYTAIRP